MKQADRQGNAVDGLNILRILAFLCVFLLHTKLFLPMAWNENVSWAWVLWTPAWGGVWIFMILSGYGIGRGFYSGRYEVSAKGILRYWIKRIAKILPVYWFYIFSVALFMDPALLTPTKESIPQLCSLLFFNYRSDFDTDIFGVAWYLTTMMRLYILAPLVFLLLKRVKSRRMNMVLFLFLLLAGLAARTWMRSYILRTSGSWDFEVYVPFYFNLDLFFCGFLLGGLPYKEKNAFVISGRIFAFLLILGWILVNSKIYYEGNYAANSFYMQLYQYVFPTGYCIATAIYIYLFDICRTSRQSRFSMTKAGRAVAGIINRFPVIQLPFYLYHPVILQCMLYTYKDETYAGYASFWHIPPEYTEFAKSCFFTFQALLLCLLWAIIVGTLLSNRPEQKSSRTLGDFL